MNENDQVKNMTNKQKKKNICNIYFKNPKSKKKIFIKKKYFHKLFIFHINMKKKNYLILNINTVFKIYVYLNVFEFYQDLYLAHFNLL